MPALIDTIILARHGEPDLSKRLRMNWRGYKYWWRLYDETGLVPGHDAPKLVKKLAASADRVLASTLPRAIETAEKARGGPIDRTDPLLVEAGLPPPNLGYIRLKPRTWGVLARICWMCGFAGDVESQKAARIRAEKAADMLSDEAKDGKIVFVAAHGWFNRMMKKPLLRRGFRLVEDHGDYYWSYRRYERTGKV